MKMAQVRFNVKYFFFYCDLGVETSWTSVLDVTYNVNNFNPWKWILDSIIMDLTFLKKVLLICSTSPFCCGLQDCVNCCFILASLQNDTNLPLTYFPSQLVNRHWFLKNYIGFHKSFEEFKLWVKANYIAKNMLSQIMFVKPVWLLTTPIFKKVFINHIQNKIF